MAITKLNSLAIPDNTIVEADLSYPLTNFSSTGIDDNATTTAITIDSSEKVGIGETAPDTSLHITGTAGDQITLQADSTTIGPNIVFANNDGNLARIASAETNTLRFEVGPSNTEAMRIDSSGNVGIDTASPSNPFHINSGATTVAQRIDTNITSTEGNVDFLQAYTTNGYASSLNLIREGSTNTGLAFKTTGTGTLIERMRIDSSGNVGIGTTSPSDELHINSTSVNVNLRLTRDTDTGARISGSGGASTPAIIFETIASGALTERMRIDSDGRIAVGTSNPDSDISFGLDLNGFVVGRYDVSGGVPTTSSGLGGVFSARLNGGGFSSGDLILQARPAVNSRKIRFFTGNTTTERMTIDAAGAVDIVGSLSKGSGSFKIDHPLPSKTDTHHLVHSFVEGPQADNLYRGTVSLVDGSATVNLDTAGGMSEGTFVCLNTNVQCFTSNESGWTAVKGSVSGNVLTITAQETCGDVVSWMVVGERCDQHMLDTEWTDENGRVIVEPLKGA